MYCRRAAKIVNALLVISYLWTLALGVEVYIHTHPLITPDNTHFGCYIEGASVDPQGNIYALNYLVNTHYTENKDTDMKTSLGKVSTSGTLKQPAVRSFMGGSWNGAYVAPSKVLKPRPDGRIVAGDFTVLLAEQWQHKVMIAWVNAEGGASISRFCGDDRMVEPNDITVASNGRVFASGMAWTENTVIGDGDIWTCSPWKSNPAGSIASRLLQRGRTNGIELSPDEKYLYFSEAYNKSYKPVKNVIWRYSVDIITGHITNPILFADFGALDGTEMNDIDGMRTTMDGTLYVVRNGGYEVVAFNPHGEVLFRLKTSFRYPSNIAFGGAHGTTLHIVGRCLDNLWGKGGGGCVDTWEAPSPGRAWTMLQNQ